MCLYVFNVCLCVCVSVYIHIYIHIYMHVCVHLYMCLCASMCLSVCLLCVHVCISVHLCVCISVHLYVCLCISVPIHVLVHVGTCGGQRLKLGVLSYPFTLFFWVRVSHCTQNSSFQIELQVYTDTPGCWLPPSWRSDFRSLGLANTFPPPDFVLLLLFVCLFVFKTSLVSAFFLLLVFWEFHAVSFGCVHPFPSSSQIPYPPTFTWSSPTLIHQIQSPLPMCGFLLGPGQGTMAIFFKKAASPPNSLGLGAPQLPSARGETSYSHLLSVFRFGWAWACTRLVHTVITTMSSCVLSESHCPLVFTHHLWFP